MESTMHDTLAQFLTTYSDGELINQYLAQLAHHSQQLRLHQLQQRQAQLTQHLAPLCEQLFTHAQTATGTAQLTLLRQAAELGYAPAQYQLAQHYSQQAQAELAALHWYTQAAAQDHVAALLDLGHYYQQQHSPLNAYLAFTHYQQAAQLGNAEAQYQLGCCYYHGHGVGQDYAHAVQCYNQAAEQGIAQAQYELGRCYYHGHGVGQDYARARQCKRLSKVMLKGNTG